jgi:hypothetical protein
VMSSPLPSRQTFSQLESLPELHPAFLIRDTSVSSWVQPCSDAMCGRYVAPRR